MSGARRTRGNDSIEIVSEQAAAEMIVDLNKRPDSTIYVEPEEKFINNYIQQNCKRIENVETTRSNSDEICSNEDSNNETNLPSQRVRHASARRLFEVNEWEEKQKRIKQKRETANAKPISSYEEIKASTKQLLEDYQQLVEQSDFEATRRREFIYRHYRCHVREPFLQAKFDKMESFDQTRNERKRFQAEQYRKFLEFINRRKFITQDDYDRNEYDAMAKFEDKSQIHTNPLVDPTLIHYKKLLNERRTIDNRRVASERGFRSLHRTAKPLSDGRTMLSALSWQSQNESNVESNVRRLASAKCFHIEQKSQNPTIHDPTDSTISFGKDRTTSASTSITIQSRPIFSFHSN